MVFYHLTCLHYDVRPTVSPFTNYKFSQPVKDLYPQVDRDNPESDPDAAISHVVSKTIGKVASSDLKIVSQKMHRVSSYYRMVLVLESQVLFLIMVLVLLILHT